MIHVEHHAFITGTSYCYPSGFSFEYGDDPIMNDPRLFNFNIDQKAQTFAQVSSQ